MASPKGGAGTRSAAPAKQPGLLDRIRGGVQNLVNRVRGNAG